MTSRQSLTGRTLAAALTLGVALALAGCGNASTASSHASSSSGSQDSPSSDAPSDTSSDSGASSTSGAALTKDNIMRVTYAAAVKAGTAHMEMNMSGAGKLTAQGDVDYGNGKPSMAMTMSMPQLSKGPMEMRYVGKVLYMQMPGLTPAGKFIAIDPTDKNSPLAKAFAGTTDQMDPLRSIKSMEAAVRSVQRVGKQSMDGVTVEHYKLTVDTAALVKGISPEAAQQANLPRTINYDLWLDEQHLLRRTSFALAGTQFTATMTKWGDPVHVQRPGADQVVAAPKS